MIGFIKSLVRVTIMRAAHRFLRNTPNNRYEKIVFDAIRTAITTFGEAPAR